ncbi:MAG: MBL fold metallo-hydrolase, partial [Nanoarchaeota archaeon]
MKVTAIASGSSGNCFYVENEKSAVLIDTGISAKKINLRMNELKLNPRKIKGIFLTHEHVDHIRGTDVFARQLNIPIYATNGTAKNGFLCSNEELINVIGKNENINIGGLEVEAFEKNHKANEPVSFSIKEKNKVVSVITDVGVACKNVNERIGMSNFLFLESNYDPKMLE